MRARGRANTNPTRCPDDLDRRCPNPGAGYRRRAGPQRVGGVPVPLEPMGGTVGLWHFDEENGSNALDSRPTA